MTNLPFQLAAVRRVLIIKLRHHGDVLLTSPVFTALAAAAPQAEIDALVYADTAPLLRGHPHLAELHTIDRDWKKLGPLSQLRAELALLNTLRQRRYDLVIHLTEHRRGAWLARLTGARWAVTHRAKGRGNFWDNSFTHHVPRAAAGRRHTVEAHLDTLRALGIQASAAQRQLLLVPGEAARETAQAKLAECGLSGRPFVHLHPASRWLFKGWTVAGWVELITALTADGLPLVLTAAPDKSERALVDAILADLPAAARAATHSLAGELSLPALAALTGAAALFVGVDSAPMHIAAAMGTPVVALFGPSGDLEWAPWGVPHRVIVSTQHPCRPCGLDGCGGGKISDCLVTLPPARVIAAARELLAETRA